MRKFFYLLVVTFLFSTLHARQMHLLLLGDDMDASIQVGVKKNLQNIEHSFTKIASVVKADLRVIHLKASDERLTRKHLIAALDTLQCKEDDIVVFY